MTEKNVPTGMPTNTPASESIGIVQRAGLQSPSPAAPDCGNSNEPSETHAIAATADRN